jgi:hypothetical protein
VGTPEIILDWGQVMGQSVWCPECGKYRWEDKPMDEKHICIRCCKRLYGNNFYGAAVKYLAEQITFEEVK